MTLDLGLPPDADGATEGWRRCVKSLQSVPRPKVIVASGHSASAQAAIISAHTISMPNRSLSPISARSSRAPSTFMRWKQRTQKARAPGLSANGVITSSAKDDGSAADDRQGGRCRGDGDAARCVRRTRQGYSPRRFTKVRVQRGNFVAINCAAIPDTSLRRNCSVTNAVPSLARSR